MEEPATLSIGVVGLGRIGLRMSVRIGKHYMVTGFDSSEDARKAAREEQVKVADSIADFSKDKFDFILLSLPNSIVVEEVINSLINNIKPGTLVIDFTSGKPEISRKIFKRLAERGVDYLDVGLTGGISGAEQGKLTIMAGGSKESFDRADHIFSIVAHKKFHVGKPGNGHAIKALNNFVAQTLLLATSEAISIAACEGIDPALANEVFNNGSAYSSATSERFPKYILKGDMHFGFLLKYAVKDIMDARSIADSHNFSAPIMALISSMEQYLLDNGGEDQDFLDLWNYYRPQREKHAKQSQQV